MDQPWSAPFLQVKPLWPYFSLVYRYTLVFWVYTWAKSLTMWGWFPNNTGCRLGNSKWGIPGANQLAGGFHPQKNARKLGVILPFGRGQSEKMKPSRSSSISQFLRELVSDLSWLEEIEIYKQFNIRMSRFSPRQQPHSLLVLSPLPWSQHLQLMAWRWNILGFFVYIYRVAFVFASIYI